MASRRSFMGAVFVLLLLQLFFVKHILVKKSHKPPHIVFIVADDLGWNDVGFHNPNIYSPTLDKLAKEGVILNSSYVHPVCSPSRSAFMTGYFPFHTGFQSGTIGQMSPYGVPLNLKFLPQRLKALGYDTHAVGKWHLGFCNWSYTPTYRGFDSFYGYYSGSQDYYTHHTGRYLDLHFNERPVRDQEGIYSTHTFSRRTVDIINQHDKSKPLFLYLPFQSIHVPNQVPEQYKRRYKHVHNGARQTVCGMVSALDEAIGTITRALDQRGLMDETLVVFTTDNGGPVGGAYANNWPLRGGKSTVWEGGTKGVAFVWGNMLKKRGYTNTGMIHAVDWFPTLVAIAGGKPEPDIDGVNQWETISKDKPSARTDFVYNIDETRDYSAIRSGDFKYMEGNLHCPCGWVAPEDKQVHLSDQYPNQRMYLFNIAADPLERNDLSEKLPDVVQAMQRKVREYKTTLHPSFQNVYDKKADPNNWDGVWSPGWC